MSVPSSSSSPQCLKIGIVGFGPFGQFLAKTMIKQGHSIRATSRTDYSQLCNNMGVSFIRDVREFLEADNDVILICTSILSLPKVMQELPMHCLKRRMLFVDVLSVKEYPKNFLLEFLPEEMDVLCTHPMFGPESGRDGWRDLAFVYERVRVRDEATCEAFLRVFQSEGCRMVEMSCEEHDRIAANSQFITHTIGRILAEMDLKSTPINTKSFESLFQLRETIASNSSDLFSGLFVHNRFAKEELKNLEKAFEKVKQKLLEKDE